MKRQQSLMLDTLSAPPIAATGYVLAFSGGRDSTALLHALTHHADVSTPIRAIHVCHHLQPESERWAEHCSAICREWNTAFERIDVRVVDRGQGEEAAARDARYAALSSALDEGEVLLSAHHAHDQAETFLLQALRGAGVDGLAAMPTLRRLGHGHHWRPWLGVSYDQIVHYAEHYGLRWVEDPSNDQTAFDRNYLRRHVLPVLAERWPAFARTLSRSAGNAGEAAELSATLARADLEGITSADALSCAALKTLDDRRQRAAIRAWLDDHRRDRPDHRHLEQIRRLTVAGMRASPCVHFGATDVRRHGDRLYCMPALRPVPATLALSWKPATELILPEDLGRLCMAPPGDTVPALRVTLRLGGERIVVAGGRRRLSEALRAADVAPWLRERMPLVYCGETLVAAGGFWRHPDIDALVGAPVGAIRWRHAIVGMPFRVVGDPPFG